jgi:hypothetical protein
MLQSLEKVLDDFSKDKQALKDNRPDPERQFRYHAGDVSEWKVSYHVDSNGLLVCVIRERSGGA